MKKRVLFICTHNSARSPMAEGLLRHLGAARRRHWSFENPSKATGSDSEQLEVYRRVRDEIRSRSC